MTEPIEIKTAEDLLKHFGTLPEHEQDLMIRVLMYWLSTAEIYEPDEEK